jgi:hypothetical protein
MLASFDGRRYSREDHRAHFNIWGEFVKQKLVSIIQTEFVNGFNSQARNRAHLAAELLQSGRQVIISRVERFIDRFVDSLLVVFSRRAGKEIEKLETTQTVLLEVIHSSFASHTYRLEFALDMETRKAFNYGKVLGMKFNGVKQLTHLAKESACDTCLAFHNQVLNTSTITLDDIAPHHPNCICSIVAK